MADAEKFVNDGGEEEISRLRASVAALERRAEAWEHAALLLVVRDAATRALAESSSLLEAAPRILRAVCETLGWEVGGLWVVQPHADVLRCIKVWHADSAAFPEFDATTRRTTLARGQGLPGRVWSSGQPAWIPDVTQDENFPRAPVAAKEGLRAAFGFPVAIGSKIEGVIEFFSRDILQPDEELLAMLGALGSQIGQYIERKNAEEMLDRFFTLSPDMLCIAGYDGYFKRLNPAWEESLGYRLEELMALPFLDFVHPGDRRASIKAMEKLEAGHNIISFENRYRAKDNTYRWLLWTAAPSAQHQLIYAGARDITERKQIEGNMIRLQGEAEAANRAKTEFLARMSHEIRTPLNVVIGMGDLLDRTALNTEQRQYVRVFQRAGGNLLSLINDILDLAKVESGRIVLEDIDFEVIQALEGVVEIMTLRAKEKGIDLGYEVDPETPARLMGDPDRLRQVLINLVSNAIKFTAKGRVLIRAGPDPESEEPGTLRFSVSDSGIGIPPEKLEDIFEAFTQVDASTTRKYGGTGLGLAISRRFVELMNGRIWAENVPSGGAVFHFTAKFGTEVPAQNRVSGGSEEQDPQPHRGVKGMRILVADDSEENRFLVSEYLRDLGCHLDFAEDGSIAVEKFRASTYDLVLMDLQMPVMDGYAATRRIRGWEEEEKRAPTPILVLTASALESELQKAIEAGATAWLRKPVRLLTLLETVGKYAAPNQPKIVIQVNPRLAAVVPGYLGNRRGDAQKILAAIERGDFDTVRDLGHKMCGTGGGYGFQKITEIGEALERAAKQRNAAEVAAQVAALSAYLDQVEVV